MNVNLLRPIKKITLIIEKTIISGIDFVNPRLYMKLFNRYLRRLGIDVRGKARFVHPTVWFDGIDYSKIHIGNNVVISKDVKILIHDYSIASGIRALGKERKDGKEELFLKDVFIGNNVFIGTSAIIMYGSNIGENVIVGAGAVVKGKVPDGSIIVGNPSTIQGCTLEWAQKHLEFMDYTYR